MMKASALSDPHIVLGATTLLLFLSDLPRSLWFTILSLQSGRLFHGLFAMIIVKNKQNKNNSYHKDNEPINPTFQGRPLLADYLQIV